jgi:PTS system nitrogen regulatory IIA component
MPNLLQYLSPDRVILPLSSSRKVDAIREIASLYRKSEKVTDFRVFLSALLQKEKRFGSGVEKGVALPHYRDDSIVEPIVGLGVSPKGLDWGGGQTVHILVLVGWPNKHQGAYLNTVAELASALHQPKIRSRILESNAPVDVVQAIRSGLSADVTA